MSPFTPANPSVEPLVESLVARARPFEAGADLAPLIERLSKARVVMLGEASHGTHEFYEWRKEITRQLIQRHGFDFVAVEGDWPPCQKVHRFVTGGEEASGARQVLSAFNRWPTWMWANEEMVGLIDWLRQQNRARMLEHQVGFHGLDVYSLFESIDAVLGQLDRINPFLARRARRLYGCFERFGGDENRFARSLLEFPEGCEDQVVAALQELLELRIDGLRDREAALFDARQNARIIQNAEAYFRAMVRGNDNSWNIRDRHMMETLDRLLDWYGADSKAIVWEHNTHIGDYRATDMAQQGEVNLGGLARERYGAENVALVGFGTDRGTVIASHAWDGPVEILPVPPGKAGSCEEACHIACERLGASRFYLTFSRSERQGPLAEIRGHRAIGVVYDPMHERWGNYVPTSLARRYDAFLFVDQTRALEPLPTGFDRRELPETWPVGQ